MSYPEPSQNPPQSPPTAVPIPSYPAPTPPPGYPAYPQGGYLPYPMPIPNPQGANPYPYPTYPMPYQGGMPGYGIPYVPAPPKDTYRLVIGIICTIFLSLTVLLGLVVSLLSVVASFTKAGDNLLIDGLLYFVATIATIGGGVGLYFTIRALMGRPSAPLRLPSFWVSLALSVVVLGVAIVQFDLGLPQAPAIMETPLVLLAGIFPAITIFTFTAERLGFPTTWRRVWMSYLSGTFLATTLALILELIASGILTAYLRADAGNISQINTNNNAQVIAVLLLVAVVAPIVEEGFKPVGPLTIIGRLRNPAEAFLIGMAAGIGFAIFETVEYIASGVADWSLIAVGRVGAGLIHGVGAGMATLGWYYIFRGRGISQRYLKGFGAIGYAIAQHGIFNASNFLALVPGFIGDALNAPVWFFGLPVQGSFYLTLAIYVGIVMVLLTVTQRIKASPPPVTNEVPLPTTPAAVPQMTGGVQ